uniref:Uncharacterized protein n=1 Tax=Nelumbo nucifera TaxID=4432 RepID=A0A822ZR83_NELNU|nr:TPA_asm: hypothetical protein HUJ06_004079 [Nelumbo nucifera]
MMILERCKELVELHVTKCSGFEADDEVLKLSSHIKSFRSEGSKVRSWYEEWDDLLCMIDIMFA